MKALVVYESTWGQSEQVARAVAKGLGTGARAVEVGQAVAADVDDLHLLVVGGSPHAFSTDRSTSSDVRGIPEWLAELPEDLVVPAATFEMRVSPAWDTAQPAGRAASHELMRHHHSLVVRSSVFYLRDVRGPIVDGELERALAWGQHLAACSHPADGPETLA